MLALSLIREQKQESCKENKKCTCTYYRQCRQHHDGLWWGGRDKIPDYKLLVNYILPDYTKLSTLLVLTTIAAGCIPYLYIHRSVATKIIDFS